MHGLSSFRHAHAAFFLWLLAVGGAVCTHSGEVQAQETQNRVLWQLDFAPSLNAAQKSQIQTTMMNTLSRAKERHFVGDQILTNKIKKEGLNFPECFSEGQPCSAGGAFVLDVHNVDVYAKAIFTYENGEWIVGLKVYRNLSASAVEINQMGASLPDLLQTVVSSLFELEAGVEITSTLPNVEIYINQKLVGTTPMALKVPAGDQNIILKKSGYVTETWAFKAEKGKVYTKAADLRPEETQLTVLTTVPEAEIWIDGAFWAKSNETRNILPGDHTIEVRSENHHTYSQPYKVYPGTPQTMHVAPLPKSKDPYRVRHDGIKKYRLSAYVGYHFGTGKLGMKKARLENIKIKEPLDVNETFHGISLGLNYEAEYWGITFFRFDIGGAVSHGSTAIPFNTETIQGTIKDGTWLGFYPAQIRGHYTFWVMQAEATFGFGLSQMWVDIVTPTNSYHFITSDFSIHFNLGLKYFFSEETFAMLSYDLQYDVIGTGMRQGMTIGVGMQFPTWMRSTDVPELDSTLSEDAAGVPTEDAVIESEIDALVKIAAEAEMAETADSDAVSNETVDIEIQTEQKNSFSVDAIDHAEVAP